MRLTCLYSRLATRISNCQAYSTVANSVVQLRPYQEECIQACTDALEAGVSRCGVSLPTGSGKTIIFLNLLSRIQPPVYNLNARQALILVSNIQLAHQAAAQARRLFPSWTIDIEQGTANRASGNADLSVATWQSLYRSNRLRNYDPEKFKAIIVDEAHHSVADKYLEILAYFHADIVSPSFSGNTHRSKHHPVPIFGFSATFSRNDNAALADVFQDIVYHRDPLQMIEDGWLCDVQITSVETSLGLKDVQTNADDFCKRQLSGRLNTPAINSLVYHAWRDKAGSRKSTVVFCVGLAHLRDLTHTFKQYGVDARQIHHETPAGERQTVLDGFKGAAFPVLLNCGILTEGTDIPNIDCIVIAKPTRSRNVLTQMVGRGLRLSPESGKRDCHIIDFVDAAKSVLGMVTVPSLFGIGPQGGVRVGHLHEDALQKKPQEVQRRSITDMKAVSDSPPALPAPAKYIEHVDPFRLSGSKYSGARHLRTITTNAWVRCTDGTYFLQCADNVCIRVKQRASGDRVFWQGVCQTMDRASSRYGRQEIHRASTLEHAIQSCDKFAIKQRIRPSLRAAKWRDDPATDPQRKFIDKIWDQVLELLRDHPANVGMETTPDDFLARCRKGDAYDIIARVVGGGRR